MTPSSPDFIAPSATRSPTPTPTTRQRVVVGSRSTMSVHWPASSLADELRRMASDAYADGRAPLDDATEDADHRGGPRPSPRTGPTPAAARRPVHPRHPHLRMRTGVAQPARRHQGPWSAVADSDDDLVELIATAARRLGRSERRWDNAHPELNLQLPNGDRLHALMAVSGRPTVTVRRHDFDISRLAQLVDARGVRRAAGRLPVRGGAGPSEPDRRRRHRHREDHHPAVPHQRDPRRRAAHHDRGLAGDRPRALRGPPPRPRDARGPRGQHRGRRRVHPRRPRPLRAAHGPPTGDRRRGPRRRGPARCSWP